MTARGLAFDPRGGVVLLDGGAPLTVDELRSLAEWACATAVDTHDAPLATSVVAMPAVFFERTLTDLRLAKRAHQEVLERCTALKLEGQALKRALRHSEAECAAFRERARLAEDRARVAREVRAACDVCALNDGTERAPAAVVADGKGYAFLCADHVAAEEFKGRRIDLRDPAEARTRFAGAIEHAHARAEETGASVLTDEEINAICRDGA